MPKVKDAIEDSKQNIWRDKEQFWWVERVQENEPWDGAVSECRNIELRKWGQTKWIAGTKKNCFSPNGESGTQVYPSINQSVSLSNLFLLSLNGL